MEFMTVKEAATKWGLSERRLQTICNRRNGSGGYKIWAIMGNSSKCAKTC